MAQGDRAWSRVHKNGMIALVFEWERGTFSAGAVPSNGFKAISSNVGGPLEPAQKIADADSGCSQPCSCQPWSE